MQRLPAADDAGRELARLTRNAYGATVLNAYNVMFVDVDTTDDTSNTVDEVIVEKRQAVDLSVVCARRAATCISEFMPPRPGCGIFARAGYSTLRRRRRRS